MVNNVVHSSKSEEWFTPEWIIHAVIEVMGGIDLDPASPYPDGPVPADTHYTKADDGLKQDWQGRVFLNPPYGRDIIRWVEMALIQYEYGGVDECILLLPARPETKWFNTLAIISWCAVKGRVKFIGDAGDSWSAPFPSAIFYLGERPGRFYDVFSQFGPIYKQVIL